MGVAPVCLRVLMQDLAEELYHQLPPGPPDVRAAALAELLAAHPDCADRLAELEQQRERAAALIARLGGPSLEVLAVEDDVGWRSEERRTLEALVEEIRVPRTPESLLTIGRVARGGMSVVDKVWDSRLRRVLARKLLPLPVDAPDANRRDRRRLSRFLDEAQIASQLQHPSILSVHDIGIDARGRPYIRMPLVAGEHFGQIVRRVHDAADEAWTQPRAIGVLLRVCEAMAYAHSKGVVHRDLKPHNVMVGRFGETLVMDWGLAKVLDREEEDGVVMRSATVEVLRPQDEELRTLDGDVIGTPVYMAPEQARGQIDAQGVGVDLYAIGAMLYELCAGQPPYGEEQSGSTPREVLATVRSRSPRPLHRAAPATPPELVAVCSKAMAPSPEQRYPSVAALGRDLQAYLDQRVVLAYRTGAWAEAVKWVRRNRAVAVVAGVAFVLLALAAAWVMQQRIAIRQMYAAVQWRDYVGTLGAAAGLLRDEAPGAAQLLDGVEPSLRGWEWRMLRHLADPSEWTAEVSILQPFGDRVYCAGDLHFEVLDAETGRHLPSPFGQTPVGGLAVSPDQRRAVTVSGVAGLSLTELLFWDLARSETVRRLPGRRVNPLCFSPDGEHFLVAEYVADQEHELRTIRWDSGEVVGSLPARNGRAWFIYASQLSLIGSAAINGLDFALVDLKDFRLITTLPNASSGGLTRPSISADGSRVTSGTWHTAGHVVYDVGRRAPIASIGAAERREHYMSGGAISPDGRLLARNHHVNIEVWDLENNRRMGVLRGHSQPPKHLFFPAADTLYSNADGRSKKWRIPDAMSPTVLTAGSSFITALAFSPDAKTLYTACMHGDPAILAWDLRSHSVSRAFPGTSAERYRIDLEASGETLLACGKSQWVERIDLQSGEIAGDHRPSDNGTTWAAALPRSGGFVISQWSQWGPGSKVQLLTASGGVAWRREFGGQVSQLCVADDESWIAVGFNDGSIQLLAVDGDPVGLLQSALEPVRSLSGSRDARQLVSVGRTTARVWDVARRSLTAEFDVGSTGTTVRQCVFDPTGTRVVAGEQNALVFYLARTGERLLGWQLPDFPTAVAFSKGGDTLAVGTREGRVYVFSSVRPKR